MMTNKRNNATINKTVREFKATQDVIRDQPIILENVKYYVDQNFITICDEVNYIIYTIAISGWAGCNDWGSRDFSKNVDIFNTYLKECDQAGDFKLW